MTTIGSVLFLCTGNATRSVLAGELLRVRRPGLVVETAGTLSVGGRPISWRTRRALGLAPEHIRWVRREHPTHARRASTLIRLARTEHELPAWVASGGPGEVDLAAWEEVVDPGGGEVDAFVACAHEIVRLIDRVAPRL